MFLRGIMLLLCGFLLFGCTAGSLQDGEVDLPATNRMELETPEAKPVPKPTDIVLEDISIYLVHYFGERRCFNEDETFSVGIRIEGLPEVVSGPREAFITYKVGTIQNEKLWVMNLDRNTKFQLGEGEYAIATMTLNFTVANGKSRGLTVNNFPLFTFTGVEDGQSCLSPPEQEPKSILSEI